MAKTRQTAHAGNVGGTDDNAGGSNEIVDGDIVGHDMTATDLANFSTFAKALDAFLNNGTPSPLPFDYASRINAFRGMG